MSRKNGQASLWHRLYHGETNFDFVGRRRWWFAVSGIFILAGIVSLLAQGLNYGIEFKGGTSWEVDAAHLSVAETRDALRPLGLGDAKIQIQKKVSGGTPTVRVEFRHTDQAKQDEITKKIAELAKADPSQVNKNDFGPSWGKAVTNKARTALIVFFILITLYIALRFEWKMAMAALAAVVHDILITVGIYSISQFEVTPETVVAFLTILGYSLYDTVVVFDKVQENTRSLSTQGRMTYSQTVNLSMNQVLMRSINTSFVAIMPIMSVLFIGSGLLGASSLKDFGLALLVGLITGAYSSIFIASPMLAVLKEREPRYAAIRDRAKARGGIDALTPAEVAAMGGTGFTAAARPQARAARSGSAAAEGEVLVPSGNGAPRDTGAAINRPPPTQYRPGAPRPRKKGKRR